MATLPKKQDENLLVGYGGSDDAGVYRLTDDTALVLTADFITPPVDDPDLFGRIAAANAISDIYAMGGRPIACLNLACFPSKKLEPEILHRIVAGALSKITEAGAVLAGGHTIDDDEPKFGLSVVGVVHPGKIWTNSGARPGDALVLTKPIGSGVLFNGNLKNLVTGAAMAECLKGATALNRGAAETAADFEIHACTDITGYGLAGHAFEMARGSGVVIEIDSDAVRILPEAIDMYEKGVGTGMNRPNRERVEARMRFERDLTPSRREIMFDPQTNGGLLFALGREAAERLVEKLRAAGLPNSGIIGRALTGSEEIDLIVR